MPAVPRPAPARRLHGSKLCGSSGGGGGGGAPRGRHAQRLLRLLHRVLERVHAADVEVELVDSGAGRHAARAARAKAQVVAGAAGLADREAVAAVVRGCRVGGRARADGAPPRRRRPNVHLRGVSGQGEAIGAGATQQPQTAGRPQLCHALPPCVLPPPAP